MNPKLICLEEKNFLKASLIDYRPWSCHQSVAIGWTSQTSQSFHQLTFLLCCPWSRSKNALIFEQSSSSNSPILHALILHALSLHALILHQFAWNMKHSGSMLIFKIKIAKEYLSMKEQRRARRRKIVYFDMATKLPLPIPFFRPSYSSIQQRMISCRGVQFHKIIDCPFPLLPS